MMGKNRKPLWILAAAALAVPVMAGCGDQGQDSSAQDSTQPTSSDASQTPTATSPASQGSAEAAGTATVAAADQEGTASAVPKTTAPGAEAGTALPSVEDPCAGTCEETGRIEVEHGTWGPLTVVSYLGDVTTDAAPSSGIGSYALYQDGRPVGYAKASARTITFGPGPALGDPKTDWNLQNGSNVDRYGNVYLSGNGPVTVLTPVQDGYSSQGTLPGGEHEIGHAHLSIDPSGEPTIVQDEFVDGKKSGEKTLHWNQEKLAFTA